MTTLIELLSYLDAQSQKYRYYANCVYLGQYHNNCIPIASEYEQLADIIRKEIRKGEST